MVTVISVAKKRFDSVTDKPVEVERGRGKSYTGGMTILTDLINNP